MHSITEYRFYDYGETLDIMNKLKGRYQNLSRIPIGVSGSGKTIYALRLGSARECMLYVAAVHGNEYITTSIILRFIEDLCCHIKNGVSFCGIDMNLALAHRSLYFVPMLNPDGCEIALKGSEDKWITELCGGNFGLWKANGRGVDINHNFNADWERLRNIETEHEIKGPCVGKYGGEFPHSESETIAAVTMCRLINPYHIIALHTQGEEIYYGYKTQNVTEKRMAEIFAMTSGYSLSRPDYLSSCGGFKDWFCKEFHRPGFTFECGSGTNPLPKTDIQPIYRKLRETLAIAAII